MAPPQGTSASVAPVDGVPSSFASLDQSPLPPPPASQPIDVPPTDKRLYRAISLPNGMQALLIHDPDMAAEVKEGEKAGNAEGKGGDVSEGDDDDDDESGSDSGDDDNSSRGASLADGAITDSESDSEDEIGKKKKKGKRRDADDEEDDDDEEEEEEGASKVKKAAAAVAVGVGSLCDPLRMQGLAHYLEHMLFMGSEKYPDENECVFFFVHLL